MQEETLTQVFSWEFCEISKNTFLTEYLQATASVTQRMRHQVIKHNKFVSCIEKQVQEEETMRKVFNLIWCYDEF